MTIVEKEFTKREVLNALILAASKRIHANDKLGIVIGDFGEIAEFPFHSGFVGKQVGDLIVAKGRFFSGDKVNFPSTKMAQIRQSTELQVIPQALIRVLAAMKDEILRISQRENRNLNTTTSEQCG